MKLLSIAHIARRVSTYILLYAAVAAKGADAGNQPISLAGTWQGIFVGDVGATEMVYVEMTLGPGTERFEAEIKFEPMSEYWKSVPVSTGLRSGSARFTLISDLSFSTFRIVGVRDQVRDTTQTASLLATMTGTIDEEKGLLVARHTRTGATCLFARSGAFNALEKKFQKYKDLTPPRSLLGWRGKPERSALVTWMAPLYHEYPNIDPYAVTLDLLLRQSRPLFQDQQFEPIFGARFDDLSTSQLAGIYAYAQGAKDRPAQAVAAFANMFRPGFAEKIAVAVIADRSIRPWRQTQIAKHPELLGNTANAEASKYFKAELLSRCEGLFWPSELKQILSAPNARPDALASTGSGVDTPRKTEPTSSRSQPGGTAKEGVPQKVNFSSFDPADQKYFSPKSQWQHRFFIKETNDYRCYLEIIHRSTNTRDTEYAVILVHKIGPDERLDTDVEHFTKRFEEELWPTVKERIFEAGYGASAVTVQHQIAGWYICFNGKLSVTQANPRNVVAFSTTYYKVSNGAGDGVPRILRWEFAGYKFAPDQDAINAVFVSNNKFSGLKVHTIGELKNNIAQGVEERKKYLGDVEAKRSAKQTSKLSKPPGSLSSLLAGLDLPAVESVVANVDFNGSNNSDFLSKVIRGDFGALVVFPDEVASLQQGIIPEIKSAIRARRFNLSSHYRAYHEAFARKFEKSPSLQFTTITYPFEIVTTRQGPLLPYVASRIQHEKVYRVRPIFAARFDAFISEMNAWTLIDGDVRDGLSDDFDRFLSRYQSPDHPALRLFEANLLFLAEGILPAQQILAR